MWISRSKDFSDLFLYLTGHSLKFDNRPPFSKSTLNFQLSKEISFIQHKVIPIQTETSDEDDRFIQIFKKLRQKVKIRKTDKGFSEKLQISPHCTTDVTPAGSF